MDVRGALLGLALALAAPGAHAEKAKPVEASVGPVTLQIVESDSGEKELREGARVLVKDFMIEPGLAASFKDIKARVFDISQGGNACDGWPAVVTVDKDRKVGVDTTMHDECASFTASADPEGFTFVEPAVPGQDGSVWRFTPEKGLLKLGLLVFQPQPGSSWNDLGKMLDHPLALFACAPFNAAVRKLTAKQYEDLALRLRVASAVEQRGNYLIGRGCQAHACNSEQGFVAIERKSHAIFLAMRSEKTVTAWPKAATWPAAVRAELKSWQDSNN